MSSPRTTPATSDRTGETEAGFPRLSARTMRFTLGIPTSCSVSPDGSRVLFLRSRSGTQRTGLLWVADVGSGHERLVADPHDLLAGDDEDVPRAERYRRERMRQGGAGITSYSTDEAAERVAVTLSGRVFVLDVVGGAVVEVPVSGPAVDARLSPDGARVAYHCDGGLHVAPAGGATTGSAGGATTGRAVVDDEDPDVTWGLSDFAHAEELNRLRSFWWAPDSQSLLVARVDEGAVTPVSITDPAHPRRTPTTMRYPFAGETNPDTTLWLVGLDGTRSEVSWDHEAFEYLVDVSWTAGQDALVTVLDRHQRSLRVLRYSPGAAPRLVREMSDPAWVDVLPGVPAWWGERLLTIERDVSADMFRLLVDGEPMSPPGVAVHAVAAVDGDTVLLVVSEDDRETRLGRLGIDGHWEFVTETAAVAGGTAAGGTAVVRQDTLHSVVPTVTVRSVAGSFDLDVHVVPPPLHPEPIFVPRTHTDDPRMAVLLPTDHDGSPLPVLLDPYGGPHGQRVLSTARSFLESQWWAEQGFLVVVADGPGTPGTPSWQRAMVGQFAKPALAAQVRALQMVAERFADVADLTRVAIRGWSFGGYLAALTVLERPDLVHAAVVGAPVTDWSLYDTAYTERYLGLPTEHPGRYESESLLARAGQLVRPMLIIHGLADDNVLVANTLRLSSALLAAGREHRVLPLSGVTHMTPQEVVAENLLLAQRDFLAAALQR